MADEAHPEEDRGGAPPADKRAASKPLRSLGFIDSLRYCLQEKGERLPKALLMGLSGETFRLFYDRNHPQRGLSVFSHNPLRAACSALGYECKIRYYQEAGRAIAGLRRRLESGERAMLRADTDWVVAAGYLPGESAFRIRLPSGQMQTWTADELRRRWQPEPGFLELGLLGYYYFLVGEREHEPNRRDAALAALRRGVRMVTRRERVDGCSAGLTAYRDLLDTLTRKRHNGESHLPEEMQRYTALASPFRYLQSSRHAAARYLELVEGQFTDEAREFLRKAARLYRQAARLLEEMPPPPRPDDKPSRVLREFQRGRKRAAQHLTKLMHVEEEAVEALKRVIEVEERESRE